MNIRFICMFEEYELEGFFEDRGYYTGRDLLNDSLEWDENTRCYSGDGFELFVFDVVREN